MKLRGKYSLDDPAAFGSPVPCPVTQPSHLVLSAVKGNNADLFSEVAALWITEHDEVADVTAGRKVFWQQVPEEIRSRVRYTDAGWSSPVDCRSLPYADLSLDVVVLDPPYQPLQGGAWNGGVRGYYRLSLDSMQDVLDLYDAAVSEAARVLAPGGRLIVKCQDMSFNHRLHLVHLDVLRSMTKVGIDLADLFVLVNEARMSQPERAVRQERARRAHSYFLVGIKTGAA